MKISELIKEEYSPVQDENIRAELKPYKNIIDRYIGHENYIYRGMRNSGKLVKLDASKLNRKAANTSNYANILTSYLPSWEGWPPRNKSMVASTDEDQAYGYGSLYVAIPVENQKIGVCLLHPDFWENFPVDIDIFNGTLQDLFCSVLDYRPTNNEDAQHIVDLVDGILDLYYDKSDKFQNLTRYNMSNFKGMINEFDSKPSAVEFLNKFLDPNYGCELVNSYLDIPRKHYKEVWCSGKILLIRIDLFDELVKEYDS
jgi:hypothetical protein